MFKEPNYALQAERDKMLWTDRDMWKAGIIGFVVGMIVWNLLPI